MGIVTTTWFSLQREFSTLVIVDLGTGEPTTLDLSTRAEIVQVEALRDEGDTFVADGRQDRTYEPDNKRVEITIETRG